MMQSGFAHKCDYRRGTRTQSTGLHSFVPFSVLSDWQDPTGFVDPANVVVSYDSTARTITLTHASGSINYCFNGQKRSLPSPWTSAAHPNVNAKYFLYSTDGVNFTWSTTVWDLFTLQIAVADYFASYQIGLRECHGLMPWTAHLEAHDNIGTYRVSGGILTAGTYAVNTATDAANSPGFDAAVIKDEDLVHNIASWAEGTYTTMRIGAGSAVVFDTTATLPFRSSGSYILVNNPATGAETAATNNQYVNVYQIIVPVTSDVNSQKYRMLMLQPQSAYGSLAAAQAEDFRSLSLGDFTTAALEFVPYARITYVLASGDANTGKCRIATGGITYINFSRAAVATSFTGITALTGDVTANGPGAAIATVNGATGNFTMFTTGTRILGDFSNATIANRVAIQSSTTNGATGPYLIPNGTSTAASFNIGNASDPTNTSKLTATISATLTQLISGINGTGSYLPLAFTADGLEAMRLTASGTTTAGGMPTIQLNTPVNKVGQNAIKAASSGINTTETIIVKTPAALTANRLQAGTTIRATLIGTCTASVANISTFGVRIGTAGTTSDTLVATAATAVSAAVGTSIPFRAVIELTIRTVGATATAYGTLTLYNQGITGIATTAVQIINATMANFDTTAADFISITYKSAATTTTSTFQQAILEISHL